MAEKLGTGRDNDTRIADVDKAHAMALAEDAGQTLAANLTASSAEGSLARKWADLARHCAALSGEKAGQAYDEGRWFTPDNISDVNRKIGREGEMTKIDPFDIF